MTVEFSEEERQIVLQALAQLAVARPGWDNVLNQIALKMDNNQEGRAQMFDGFRALGLGVQDLRKVLGHL